MKDEVVQTLGSNMTDAPLITNEDFTQMHKRIVRKRIVHQIFWCETIFVPIDTCFSYPAGPVHKEQVALRTHVSIG